jgi:CHAD domain-containing protein
MPRQRFARICHDVLQEWKAARRRVLKSGASRGAVHELRIQTRRLLALEALLAPRGGPRRDDSLAALLHRVFHAAGRVRDTQLSARALQELARSAPEAARLAAAQRKRQPRLARRLQRELREVRPRRLADSIAGWFEPARGQPGRVLTRRASARLQAAAKRLATDSRAGGNTTPHSLHRRRIRVKTLRYMAEFARAAGCALPRPLSLRRLMALQQDLGAVTDLDVQARRISRFAADDPAWRPTARQLLGKLHQSRTVALSRLGIATYS